MQTSMYTIITLVDASVSAIVTLVKRGVKRLSHVYMLFVIGIGWIISRTLVLYAITELLSQIVIAAAAVNAMIIGTTIFFDALVLEMGFIGVVIKSVIAIVDVIEHRPIPNNIFHIAGPAKIQLLKYNTIKTLLSGIDPVCKTLNSMDAVSLWTIRAALHEWTCPVDRYLYPIYWIHPIIHTLLGWTYYGGAAPIPNDPTENCAGYDLQIDTPHYICIFLGFGYVLIDLIFPLLFIDIMISSLYPVVKQALEISKKWLYDFIVHIRDITHQLGKSLLTRLELLHHFS